MAPDPTERPTPGAAFWAAYKATGNPVVLRAATASELRDALRLARNEVLAPAPRDPSWVDRIEIVDAIDRDVVKALDANPGWKLLGVGVGSGGQTTLTYGWPWPGEEVDGGS